MATYGDTRALFITRMNRRDMDTTMADGFLQDAIRRIQRTLRIAAMEKAVVTNIDTAYTTNGGIFIPSDYLQLKRIMYNEMYAVTKEDEAVVVPLAKYEQGVPKYFCRRGGLWFFGPTPDGPILNQDGITYTYNTIRIDYFAEFGAMSAPTDTTILTTIAEDLLVFGALSYACDHFSDKRGDKFEARYMQIVADLQDQNNDDETSGGAAVAPAYWYADDLDGSF